MDTTQDHHRWIPWLIFVSGGVVLGSVGALLWHYSTPSSGDGAISIALDGASKFVQPPVAWWPATVLVILGAVVWATCVGYLARTRRWVLTRDPARPRRPLIAVATFTGLVGGLALAVVGRWNPPTRPEPYVISDERPRTALDSITVGSSLDLPRHIALGEPLLAFPVLGALVAVLGAVALSFAGWRLARHPGA